MSKRENLPDLDDLLRASASKTPEPRASGSSPRLTLSEFISPSNSELAEHSDLSLLDKFELAYKHVALNEKINVIEAAICELLKSVKEASAKKEPADTKAATSPALFQPLQPEELNKQLRELDKWVQRMDSQWTKQSHDLEEQLKISERAKTFWESLVSQQGKNAGMPLTVGLKVTEEKDKWVARAAAQQKKPGSCCTIL